MVALMNRTTDVLRPESGVPAEPKYRTTFLFVASMLAGFIIGWVWFLVLVLRRY